MLHVMIVMQIDIAVHAVFFICFKRGNPILKFVRNVPWEFGDIIPDYQLGSTSCALYLRQVIDPVICLTVCELGSFRVV